MECEPGRTITVFWIKTAKQQQEENGLNRKEWGGLFWPLNCLDGSFIPLFIQGPHSLSRKKREGGGGAERFRSKCSRQIKSRKKPLISQYPGLYCHNQFIFQTISFWKGTEVKSEKCPVYLGINTQIAFDPTPTVKQALGGTFFVIKDIPQTLRQKCSPQKEIVHQDMEKSASNHQGMQAEKGF